MDARLLRVLSVRDIRTVSRLERSVVRRMRYVKWLQAEEIRVTDLIDDESDYLETFAMKARRALGLPADTVFMQEDGVTPESVTFAKTTENVATVWDNPTGFAPDETVTLESEAVEVWRCDGDAVGAMSAARLVERGIAFRCASCSYLNGIHVLHTAINLCPSNSRRAANASLLEDLGLGRDHEADGSDSDATGDIEGGDGRRSGEAVDVVSVDAGRQDEGASRPRPVLVEQSEPDSLADVCPTCLARSWHRDDCASLCPKRIDVTDTTKLASGYEYIHGCSPAEACYQKWGKTDGSEYVHGDSPNLTESDTADLDSAEFEAAQAEDVNRLIFGYEA